MKKKYLFALLMVFMLWACQRSHKNQSRFEANWESLRQHPTPEWFRDAKFGIYAHWGPYSVPRFRTEWYSHWMYVNEGNPEYTSQDEIYQHHIKTYGTLDSFGYKDFIPMFTAEKFDANEWAELFERAGARFAGTVSEHADGFAMWDSQLTEWDAMDKGPKRDVMGELAQAIRQHHMKYIATYHRHWLYAWFPTWDSTTDASRPEYAGLYGPRVKPGDFVYPDSHTPDSNRYYPLADSAFNLQWLARLKEIIDRYHPDLIWFDNKMDIIGETYRKEFLSYYYNQALEHQQDVVATYKFNDLAEGTAVLDVERARMSEAKDYPWLTDDSIDWRAWCDIENPEYKSVNRLIDTFIDIISKNGCLLLNITPRADGSIPEGVRERLLKIGDWLRVNGEAVYGSRPWKIYGEGPTPVTEGHLSEENNPDNTSEDIRFTQKDGNLYVFLLDWPGEKVRIRSLGTAGNYPTQPIQTVYLLGNEQPLEWKQTKEYLEVQLPNQAGDYAYVLKLSNCL